MTFQLYGMEKNLVERDEYSFDIISSVLSGYTYIVHFKYIALQAHYPSIDLLLAAPQRAHTAKSPGLIKDPSRQVVL